MTSLRLKFATVTKIALELMALHHLTNWKFTFDRAKRRNGFCNQTKRTISLSYYFVKMNDDTRIRRTILHEIAHALVGTNHGHDEIWRAKCLEIGGDGNRCGVSDMPEGRWKANCPGCSNKFTRIRKPRIIKRYWCARCGPVRGELTWSMSTH